jgi:hypothetical protein
MRRHPIGTLLTTALVGGATFVAGTAGYDINRDNSNPARLRTYELAQGRQDTHCITDENNMHIAPSGTVLIKLGSLSAQTKSDCRVEWVTPSISADSNATPPQPGIDTADAEVTLPSQAALEADAISEFEQGRLPSAEPGSELEGGFALGLPVFALTAAAAALISRKIYGLQDSARQNSTSSSV